MEKFQAWMKSLDQLLKAGVTEDQYFQNCLRFAASNLENGRIAAQSQGQLTTHLMPRLVRQQILSKFYAPALTCPPDEAFAFGVQPELQIPVMIPWDALTSYALFHGPVGSGKSCAIEYILFQAYLRRKYFIIVIDHKGEGRWLVNLFPDAFVCPAGEFPIPWLEPIGDPDAWYFSVFAALGRFRRLHDETWTELPTLMARIRAGMRPGDPYPSWTDLSEICLWMYSQTHKQKWLTIAEAIRSLFPMLKRAAKIRTAQDFEQRLPVIILEFLAYPVEAQEFFINLHFLRRAMQATLTGHTRQLKRIEVVDEAHMVFGKEITTDLGSGYISGATKFITQISATGTGILAASQSLWHLDTVLRSNACSLITLGVGSSYDLEEARQVHRLACEEALLLQSLKKGEAIVTSLGFEKAAKVQIPLINKGPYPSDDFIKQRSQFQWAILDQDIVYSDTQPRGLDPVDYITILKNQKIAPIAKCNHPVNVQSSLDDDLISFLFNIVDHPDYGTADHYKSLGIGDSTGNRIKSELLAQGMISVQKVKGTGRPKEILVLTPRGKSLIK